MPHQAERAIRHYFSPGNLTALRELALRRTAQRVDDQMVRYMQAHAIPGPWAAGERILACIGGDASSTDVVRHAKRMADSLRAPWTAVHVETGRDLAISDAERDRIAEAMRLAQRLGAETVTLPGQDVADTIAEYAGSNNFTHIIIVQPPRAWWRELFYGSLAQQLIRKAGGAGVHVLGRSGEPPEQHERTPLAGEPRAYLGSLAFAAVSLGIALLLHQVLGLASVAMTFLTAVLVSAVVYGLWPALFASFASVLAYNFFFLPPVHTFTIADPENVVALFFFGVTAVIASNLTARVRSQAIVARQRARTTEELYQFSRKLAGAANLDDLLWATVHQIALMLKVRVVILLPDDNTVVVRAGYPPEDMLDAADLAAAKWSWEKNHVAGRGSDTLPGAKWLFMPINTGRGAVGVVGIDSDEPGPILTPDQQRLFDALADQAALAIERLNLVEDVESARLVAETDRLRAALLTSISHDLRTPLASILGSATSLSETLDVSTRLDLTRNIQDEAERLNRFIGNLLDMTRLESGPLAAAHRRDRTVRCDRQCVAARRKDPGGASHVGGAAARPADARSGRGAVRAGAVQSARQRRQVCACRLADHHQGVAAMDGHVVVQVLDEGPGIPAADLERVFDKFYRVGGADRRRAGTGPGPRDLPRLHRGDARHHHGEQSHRPHGRDVHHDAAGVRRRTAGRRSETVIASDDHGSGPLRILVVDDEPAILRFLRAGLGSQGYVVVEAATGQAALDAVRQRRADLVVLDLGLPDIDGLEVIRRIRETGAMLPIIVLSSRDNEAAKVAALDLGADDYVTKPFGIDELLARIRAAQRHRLQQQGEKPVFRTGDLTVDLVRRIVTVRGQEVKFSPREYDLLRLLVAHAGKVLTHNMILREVWGPNTDVQYLRIYVRALRQKIERDTDKPEYIVTETGVGYRLRAPD